MTHLLRPALLTVVVLGAAAVPAPAQYRSYFYGPPPATLTQAEPSGARAVVYGAGQGSPVDFGTSGSQFYSPGYATSYYRTPSATYTPPGYFDPEYVTPTLSTRPTYTYTPGYYSYTYTPAATTTPPRPSYPAPRVYRGYAYSY